MNIEEKLIGPRSDERGEGEISPENVLLEDGSPLYFALLSDEEVLTIGPSKIQELKNSLADLIELDKEAVLNCQGKTLAEARTALKLIQRKGMAA